MSSQVQLRRGTSAQTLVFTGAVGEVTVNTTSNTLVVQDGVTAGGWPVVGTTQAQTLTNKTLLSPTFSGNVSLPGTIISDVTLAGNINASSALQSTISGNLFVGPGAPLINEGIFVVSTNSSNNINDYLTNESLGRFVGADNANARISIQSSGTIGSNNALPGVMGITSRGTLASPTAVSGGDVLLSLAGKGYNGTTYTTVPPASISIIVDNTAGNAWTSSSTPAGFIFTGTGPGSTNTQPLLRIHGNGQMSPIQTISSISTLTGSFVTPGGAGIGGNLYVGGNIVLSNNFTTNGNIYTYGNLTAPSANVIVNKIYTGGIVASNATGISAGDGSITSTGPLTIGSTGTFSGSVTITDNTQSSVYNNTGALVVTGGFATGGNIIAGNTSANLGQGSSVHIFYGNTILGSASPLLSDAILTITRNTGSTIPSDNFEGTLVHLAGQNDGNARIIADTYGGTSSTYSAITGRRARGTAQVPTGVLSGDVLFRVAARGYGTTGFPQLGTGRMGMVSEGNFSDTSMPTALTFETTALNSNTRVESMRIASTGNVSINTTTQSTSTTTGALVVAGGAGIGQDLYVGGNLYIAGNSIIENTYVNNVTATTTDTFVIKNGTNSTSTTTGALQVSGGAGITADVNIGGNTYIGLNGFVNGSITSAYLTASSGINNSPIGLITPSTGAFTTLSSSGTTGLGQTIATSINATPIGNATPNTGAFTSLSSTLGITGTLHTASQTYITSVGVLTGLVVSGGTTLESTLNVTGATVLGANVLITSTEDMSGTASTGSLQTAGGLSVAGNVFAGKSLYLGSAALAQSSSFAYPAIVATNNGPAYAQVALKNTNSSGSADYAAYGDTGTDSSGWVDMGFTGTSFSDPNYTITNPNDGYLITRPASNSFGGNLVLATSEAGSYNDIIIGVGSFSASAEVARFHGNATTGGYFTIETGTAASSTSTGAFRVHGGAGITGNLYAGNFITSGTGNFASLAIYGTSALSTVTASGITTLNGNVVAASGTSSSSTTTGALVVTGGAGVSGAVYAGSLFDNGNRVLTSFSSSGAGNLTVSISDPTSSTVSLTATGPGATTVGSSSAIPVITTDAYGRVVGLTSASITTTLGVAGGSGTGTVALASQSLTVAGGSGISTSASGQTITVTNTGVLALSSSGAGNVTVSASTGSITVALPSTGPGATTVGSATSIPVITTDAYGRVVGLSSAAVSSTLNLAGTSGTGSVSLTNQTLTFAGTNGFGATVSGSTITLSDPQNLQTSASPTFAGATISGTSSLGIVNASGQVSITNTTSSTNSSSGALIVSGGAGIGGNLYVAGNITAGGNINFTGNVVSTNFTTSNGVFTGNTQGFGALYAGIATGYFLEPQMVIQATGNYNGYSGGINMQNINSGSLASTDAFWTPNNGTANDTYLDIGIASSTYSYPGFNLINPNDAYIISYGNATTGGGNLLLTTGSANDIVFAVQGVNPNNEVMRVTRANVVAISSTVASTSTTTGAMTIAGGLGVAGAAYHGSVYDNGNRVVSTSSGAGNLSISGTAITLPATGPGAVNVGSSTSIPTIVTDAYGRIVSLTSNVVSTTISLSGTSGSGSVAGGGTLTFAGTNGITATASGSTITVGIATSSTPTVAGLLATGNVVAASGTASTSNVTGALVVTGGAGITGNLYVQGNIYQSGVRVFKNTTTSNVAPTNSVPGDEWYNSATDVFYKYLFDGTNYNWVDLISASQPAPTLGAVTANSISVIGGLSAATVSDNGNRVITSVTHTAGTGITISSQTTTGPAASVTITNSGVTGITAGTDITISGSTGNVTVNDASTFATVTARGATTSVALAVNNNLTMGGHVLPSANVTYNLGSSTAWWNNFYGTAIHASYADVAENYLADTEYEPGTVLMFGGDEEVTLADVATSRVAGVVSTDPAMLMNGKLQGQYVTAIALQGRVPCKVTGTVRKGDMMVAGPNGTAQSSTSPAIGSVIGKALQNFDGDQGVIEIVVGRV